MALMAATFFPLVVLQVIGMVFHQSGSDGRQRIRETITSVDAVQVILIVMAVMAVAAVGLLVAAMARFQRARLILN